MTDLLIILVGALGSVLLIVAIFRGGSRAKKFL